MAARSASTNSLNSGLMKKLFTHPWFFSFSVFFILWLLLASAIDLGADEAHYVLYGMHPDWSYFDHPPLVGWIQSLFVKLGFWLGISAHSPVHRIWFRLPSLLSFIWVLFECYHLRIKAFSLWSFSLAIVPGVMSLFFLPDTILLPLCLRLIRISAENPAWTARRIILIGLLLGLCGLSKYTAILVLPAFLYVAWHKLKSLPLRQQIFTILSLAGISLVTISPVLLWNATHDWISLKYQWSHILGETQWSWTYLGASLLSQWMGYGLILIPMLLLLALKWIQNTFLSPILPRLSFRLKSQNPSPQLSYKEDLVQADQAMNTLPDDLGIAQRALLILGLTVLIFFLKSSPYTFTLLHWTLVGWWALWLSLHDKIPVLVYRVQLYTYGMIWTLVTILLYLPLKLPELNLREVRGWPLLMSEINSQLSTTDCLLISNWSYASRALFYAPSSLQSRIFVADERKDQFDLWEQKRSHIICQKKYALIFSSDSKSFETMGSHGLCPLIVEGTPPKPRTVEAPEQNWSHSYSLVRCKP